MKTIKNITLLLILMVGFTSCKKEEINNNNVEKGSVKISFDYVWGPINFIVYNEPTGNPPIQTIDTIPMLLDFKLNEEFTHPRTLKRIKFNEFNVRISNIRFKDEYNNWTQLSEDSNFYDNLSSISPQNNSILIENIPVGNYIEMTYTVGIDSIKQYNNNTSIDCIGSIGCTYAFISGFSEGINFRYHFRGYNLSTDKTTNFNGNIIQVLSNNVSEIRMVVNPSYLWNTNNTVYINFNSNVYTNNEHVKLVSDDFISSIEYKN